MIILTISIISLSLSVNAVLPARSEAGERLINSISPRFDDIATDLLALTDIRQRVAGNIRLTLGEHALQFFPVITCTIPAVDNIPQPLHS
ncbi:hypothetical protein [Citrobacter pasteurii]